MNLYRSLVVVLLLCVGFPLFAQNPEEGERPASLELSLQQAVDYAVEHNRALQNASLSMKRAEAARWQTIASMLPQVQGSFSYSNMCGYQMDMGTFSIPMNPSGTLNLSASVALSGSQVVASLIRGLSIEMSDITRAQEQQRVESLVLLTYMQIQTTEQTIALLRLNLQNMEATLSYAQTSAKVGVMEQVDADKVAVNVAQYKNRLTSAVEQSKVLYNTLRLALGVGVETDLHLTQSVDELMDMGAYMLLLSTDLDLNNNYTYQLTAKSAEMAKKQITLSAMEFVPSANAYYQYNYKSYFGQDEGMNMTPPNTVGASVSIPLWSSGVRSAAVTEKKLAYKEAQNTLMDTEDQLRSEDVRLKTTLTTAIADYQLQRENVKVSQRVLDATNQKFTLGYASSSDVTTDSQALINAQSSYVDAVAQVVSSYIELRNLLNVTNQ